MRWSKLLRCARHIQMCMLRRASVYRLYILPWAPRYLSHVSIVCRFAVNCAGDGWPAFHGNGSVKEDNGRDHVCTPLAGSSEVVCSKCGAHLGDFFKSGGGQPFESYYCVDGVCMLPPGAPAGHVCQPAADGTVGKLSESRGHQHHHHHHH